MLYIHPEECIDCEACVPECPVEAIFLDENIPEGQEGFTALNAELSLTTPVITEQKEPLV
jgi:ferredoxin